MVKIATWNVNSVNARLPLLLKWLELFSPDIMLLQELKCTNDKFPSTQIEDQGYNIAVNGQKSYNGVAIISKSPIDIELTTLPGDNSDEQARYIEAFTCNLTVASIYLPNGNPIDSDKYPYKISFMERLHDRVAKLLLTGDPFVLGGDYNVIPDERDCSDPKSWEDDALFRSETLKAWRKIMYLGVTDAFRAIFEEGGHYSFWDYQGGAWNRDLGIRIDHLLLSPQSVDLLEDVGIDKSPRAWQRPSDHVPVWCDLKL